MNGQNDKEGNGLEVSSFRPQWRNLLNLISKTQYKDLSTSLCSGRDDDRANGFCLWVIQKDLFYISHKAFLQAQRDKFEANYNSLDGLFIILSIPSWHSFDQVQFSHFLLLCRFPCRRPKLIALIGAASPIFHRDKAESRTNLKKSE